jgi:hypothetical protein
MEFTEQLEEEPLSGLVRYEAGTLQDAVAFVGTLRKHPYDKDKCLLLADHADAKSASASPTGEAAPAILEFRKADVQGVEEQASQVDESGSSRQLVRLWVRRGSRGVRYEPFEVDEPLRLHGTMKPHLLSGSRP